MFRWSAVIAAFTFILGIALGWVLAKFPLHSHPLETSKSTLAQEILLPPEVTLGGEEFRWLAVGGGSLPEFNQVSIQQNLQRWSELYRHQPGQVLASSGGNTRAVQVLPSIPSYRGLRGLLGDVLLPKPGRDTVYQPVAFSEAPAATRAHLLTALRRSLSADGPALTLLLTGHGEEGATRKETTFGLWLADQITVEDLSGFVDDLKTNRPLRTVVTSCYSGGFADITFVGGDHQKGPAEPLRCGLFATRHDRVASGCDPNPDRSVQQGYSKYLFEALGGPIELTDFDADGRVSLLEAHTAVRLRSPAADLPTTTSERWLEVVAPSEGPEVDIALPVEDALIEALRRRGAHRVNRKVIQAEIEASDEALERAQIDVDRTWRDLAGPVLARWPELDDPWHPNFPAALESAEAALRGLGSLPVSRAYGDALTRQAEALNLRYAAQARLAPLDRLEQAQRTRRLARRLAAMGGSKWRRFRQLRACESSP